MKKVNYLGKKSLSALLRYLVEFTWYSQWVFLGLIMVKFVGNIFSPGNTFSWPVSFTAKIHGSITSPNPDIVVKGLKITEGTLHFDTMNHWHANALMLLGTLLLAIPFLLITFQLRKILKSFVSNDPFLKSNLRRVRSIGFILISYPIVVYIFGIGYIQYLNYNFGDYGFVNSLEVWPLFFGLLTLLLSEVFRLGLEYREDNDLTI